MSACVKVSYHRGATRLSSRRSVEGQAGDDRGHASASLRPYCDTMDIRGCALRKMLAGELGGAGDAGSDVANERAKQGGVGPAAAADASKSDRTVSCSAAGTAMACDAGAVECLKHAAQEAGPLFAPCTEDGVVTEAAREK